MFIIRLGWVLHLFDHYYFFFALYCVFPLLFYCIIVYMYSYCTQSNKAFVFIFIDYLSRIVTLTTCHINMMEDQNWSNAGNISPILDQHQPVMFYGKGLLYLPILWVAIVQSHDSHNSFFYNFCTEHTCLPLFVLLVCDRIWDHFACRFRPVKTSHSLYLTTSQSSLYIFCVYIYIVFIWWWQILTEWW